MIRIFDNNVLSYDKYKSAIDNKIKFILIDNRTIKFELGEKNNQLASLPVNFIWEINDKGISIMSTIENKKNFEKVFYHKIVGTYTSLIKNAISGLIKNYKIKLLIVGSGYRSVYNSEKHYLELFVGFANTMVHKLYPTTLVKLEKGGTEITLTSHNKEHIGHDAKMIRLIKVPNVYSGSGIHYADKPFAKKEIKKKSS